MITFHEQSFLSMWNSEDTLLPLRSLPTVIVFAAKLIVVGRFTTIVGTPSDIHTVYKAACEHRLARFEENWRAYRYSCLLFLLL